MMPRIRAKKSQSTHRIDGAQAVDGRKQDGGVQSVPSRTSTPDALHRSAGVDQGSVHVE